MGRNFAQSGEWFCVDSVDMGIKRIEWIKLKTRGIYFPRASYHVIAYANHFVSIILT